MNQDVIESFQKIKDKSEKLMFLIKHYELSEEQLNELEQSKQNAIQEIEFKFQQSNLQKYQFPKRHYTSFNEVFIEDIENLYNLNDQNIDFKVLVPSRSIHNIGNKKPKLKAKPFIDDQISVKKLIYNNSQQKLTYLQKEIYINNNNNSKSNLKDKIQNQQIHNQQRKNKKQSFLNQSYQNNNNSGAKNITIYNLFQPKINFHQTNKINSFINTSKEKEKRVPSNEYKSNYSIDLVSKLKRNTTLQKQSKKSFKQPEIMQSLNFQLYKFSNQKQPNFHKVNRDVNPKNKKTFINKLFNQDKKVQQQQHFKTEHNQNDSNLNNTNVFRNNHSKSKEKSLTKKSSASFIQQQSKLQLSYQNLKQPLKKYQQYTQKRYLNLKRK